MAERDGDQGFEVVPTRLGGPAGHARKRRRQASILLVVILAVAIPGVAWVGPRIDWRPEVDLSFLRPSPVPSGTPDPSPRPSLPTPLPAITIANGPHPTEAFAIDVDGVRLADPATGSLGPPLGLRGDRDAIFSERNGGLWCLCFGRVQASDRETVTPQIRRVDRSGRTTMQRTVGEYESIAPAVGMDFYTRFDLEVSSDGRLAYLVSATRGGDEWTIGLEAIDVATGEVVARTALGSVTVPPLATRTAPPDQGPIENYMAGPFMRLSPDSTRLLVWAWVEEHTETMPMNVIDLQSWLIDLDPDGGSGAVGPATPLAAALTSEKRICYWLAWMTDVELVGFCWPVDGSTTVTFNLFDIDGRRLGQIDLPDAMSAWVAEPVLDRANRLVFLWQPEAHVLQRIDLDGGQIDELTVDPRSAIGASPGSTPAAGDGALGLPPDWATFMSDLRLYYSPMLLPEPGTRRLFALGVLPGDGESQGSSGIWVIDGSGPTLLDRWGAVAAYNSIGLSSDGRWLLAAGRSGSDHEGNETNWEASITIHDASDGRPTLQLGQLGSDFHVLQVPP